jgi:hypothetical protein
MISVQRSSRPNKKYMALVGDTAVHFGAVGYEDFTSHKDVARKALYLARHRPREDWTLTGLRKPGFWARYLLWSEPTLQASVNALNKRFPSLRVVLRN